MEKVQAGMMKPRLKGTTKKWNLRNFARHRDGYLGHERLPSSYGLLFLRLGVNLFKFFEGGAFNQMSAGSQGGGQIDPQPTD